MVLILAFLPIAGVACGGTDLKANFTASPSSGVAPITVQFIDKSDGDPVSWAWDFNNDGTVDSTEADPVHTYDTPAIYTASLKVTWEGNKTDTKTETINATGIVYTTTKIVFQSPYPETDIASKALKLFKEMVEEKTAGKVTIDAYYNGTLYSHVDEFEALRSGALDAAVIHPGYCRSFDSNLDFSGMNVGLILTKEHGRAVNSNPVYLDFMSSLFGTYNMQFMGYLESFIMTAYMSSSEMDSLYDFNNKNIYNGRPGSPEPYEAQLGGKRIYVPVESEAAAVAAGQIDIRAYPVTYAYAGGAYTMYHHTLLRSFYSSNTIQFNKTKWDSLQPELRTLITDTVIPAVQKFGQDNVIQETKDSVKGLKEKVNSIHIVSQTEENAIWEQLKVYPAFTARAATMNVSIMNLIKSLRPTTTTLDADTIAILNYAGIPVPS